VARDATARLYDVDEDRLVYKKPSQQGRYDHGTITFQAKKGKLVDLAKLHESIWATRLSGGTHSGAVCLEVTAVGNVEVSESEVLLNVDGMDRQFVLVDDVRAKPQEARPSQFRALRDAAGRGQKIVSVTGYVEGWVGRWPTVLSMPPAKRPALMVTSFQIQGDNKP
jgi:hypothetical protein